MNTTIAHKAITVARNPVVSITDKSLRALKGIRKSVGLAVLERAGVVDAIQAFARERPPSAIPPSWGDLWYLFSMVRKQRPRVIFEYGSGVSTVVLAKAAQQMGCCKLFSIESEFNWAESTYEAMPERLKRYVTMVHSPVVKVELDGRILLRHTIIPDETPDFVYLDGPALQGLDGAIDLLEIEDRFPSGFTMVIDNRLAQAELFRRYFRRRYRYRARKLWRQATFVLVA